MPRSLVPLVLLLAVMPSAVAFAAAPVVEPVLSHEIVRATAEARRNGEASFLPLKDGSLLLLYGAHSKPGDWDRGEIRQIRSRDGGKTWSEPETVFGDPMRSLFQCSLARLPSGDLGLTHTSLANGTDAIKVFRRSSNEGKSWSEPIVISDKTHAYTTGPWDKLYVLESGRVLALLHCNLKPDTTKQGGPLGSYAVYSDDDGKTWTRSPAAEVLHVADNPHRAREWGFWEPAVVEHAPGMLLMLGRTPNGWLWESRSADNGTTWSMPVKTAVPNPVAPPVLTRVPGTDMLVLIQNPEVDLKSGWHGGPRRVLAFRTSTNGGRTWSEPTDLYRAAEEKVWVDYPAIRWIDGNLHLVWRHIRGAGVSGGVAGVSMTSLYHLAVPAAVFTTARAADATAATAPAAAQRAPGSVPVGPSASHDHPPLRILPLGDSITRGSYLALSDGQAVGLPHPDGGGWRKGLQDRLRAAGIAFDFVGGLDSLAYGRDGKVDPDFDPHHHGLAGFGNARILSGGTVPTPADVLAARGVTEITVPPLADVLAREKPDVILLMSGANGFDAAARDRLIRTIGEKSGAHLFVATILPQKAPRGGWENVDAYNASLPAVVAAQQAAGKRITLVDMHAALTATDLLPDGVHPTRAGMDKIAATWFTALTSLRAAEPVLEKVDIFRAKTGGYMLYRIPGIVVTAKGTVLASCEARKNDRGDWGPIDILLRRSTDGGRTWGEPHTLADVPGPKQKNPVALKQKLATNDEVTYNNCTLFADRAGPVHALFCLEYARCFSIRSDDDGLTWSKPVEITKTFETFRTAFDWKVLATGPAHGLQLRSGRLVVPVWLSTGTGGHAHRPSVTATIYSDDSGATWHAGEIAVPNTPEWINPNETVVVELADGRVMLNVRSESKQHRRLVTTSRDGATGWTPPRFDDALLEPICMASIVRYSLAGATRGKNRILFANPHWLERIDGKARPGDSRDRKNVSVKLSYDEGQTWPVNKSLEAGFSGYSDLAVLPDGTILCFYERGSLDGKNIYATGLLTVARFTLEWLTDGADTTAAK